MTNDFQNDVMKMLLSDRRASRRWSIIRTILWIIIVALIIYFFASPSKDIMADSHLNKPYVSLVRLKGIIMPGSNFSADNVTPLLQKAFRDPRAKGVVLEINSPGGSPVQAQIIHDAILHLKKQYHKKVVVIGQDTLASGAYLVATAADKIIVHADTVTGSIGVIMSGFGFTGAIQKLGITRRVFTAGTNKDRMDPFMPLTTKDTQKVNQILTEVHQGFIEDVKAGRQGKLKGTPQELFSGDFWTGTTAVKLGLADETANLWTVLQQEFNVKFYHDYSAKPSLIELFLKGSQTVLHFHLQDDVAPLREQLHY